ncbi:unnamed protein product [Rotaria sp. Silwood2]|nr:unnamed protein product [Rotaria sp. Silwood2]CAF2513216.1 unnamed protein product [Rotaria sp. Silwood2]CAF2748029.1 unnamed protein product [Rotaria sp. Silwood2]CAF2892524.1 unnamed protein product [Rotaria sp. Silwood2]CAF3974903.1 unnamed protein product [Rotaria sp. Silwood2]
MEALVGAGLMPLPSKSVEKNNSNVTPVVTSNEIYSLINEDTTYAQEEEKLLNETSAKFSTYPSLVELKAMIDEQSPDAPAVIEPPSIEPLKEFLEKRAITIEGLKDLRVRMAKHVMNCKISNTVGNSASIIGGLLCFVFPPIGVPVLLAGTATSLGTTITEGFIEKRLRKNYMNMIKEDAVAMKVCETNIKDITAWLVTVYSLGYSVSKAGVNFLQLSEAIQAASTLGTWAELVTQLPSLAGAFATGAKTAGTLSGKILGISVIISVADLIQTWISKNATLKSIDKDIGLLEQQLMELERIAEAYHP